MARDKRFVRKSVAGRLPRNDALNKAAREGRVDDVRELLDSARSWHIADALTEAACYGRTAVVGVVLDDCELCERDVARALAAAAEQGHADVVELLLARESPGKEACTRALLAFAESDEPSVAVARLLVDAGADVNTRHWNSRTPLHYLAGAREGSGDVAGVVELLLARGADAAAASSWGLTPLHCWASRRTSPLEIAELLLGAGAAADARDRDGNTLLHLAATARDDGDAATVIKWLLARGAGATEVNNRGETLLHAWAGSDMLVPEVGELLVAVVGAGSAAINAQASGGVTALHWAAGSDNSEPSRRAAAVQLLLAAGADASIGDDNDFTPLDYACDAANAALRAGAAPPEVADGALVLLERGARMSKLTWLVDLLIATVRCDCATAAVQRLLAATTFSADALVDAANVAADPSKNGAARLVLAQLCRQDLPRLLQEIKHGGRLSALPGGALLGVVSALADESELARQQAELARQRAEIERERPKLERQRREVQQQIVWAAGALKQLDQAAAELAAKEAARAAALERGQASMDRFVTKRPRAAAAAAAAANN